MVQPLGDFAQEGQVVMDGAHTLTYVPIDPIPNLYFGERSQARLVFFDRPDGAIGFRLLAYLADSTYFEGCNHNIRSEDFTGVIYQIDTTGRLVLPFVANNGNIIGRFNVTENNSGQANSLENRDPCYDICYPCACIYLGKKQVYLPPIWASLTEEPGDFSVLVLGDFFRCDCSFTNLNEWPNDIWK
ncbi:MAG: hypothetical protein H6566_11605 [Lewinellaceae bacterium]|nr:hypothetical protein [Lewinellaceae bacterium]